MDLNEIAVFVKVVQSGNLSRAAESLAMPKSTVSRKLAQLESRLGVSLLQRTTRKLNLTEAGADYFRRCSQVLAELQEAEVAATSTHQAPQGLLRVTAPVEMGTNIMGPLVREFMKEYPLVTVELLLTDSVVDLVGEGVDIALRAGDLEDSTLMAKKIGSGSFHLVASAAYLRAHGAITHPKQLEKHECLNFTNFAPNGIWELLSPKGKVSVRISGKVSANNLAVLYDLTMAGHGVSLLPGYLFCREVMRGKLVRVLPEWSTGHNAIHVVHAGQRFTPPKVRAFVEFAAKYLKPLLEE